MRRETIEKCVVTAVLVVSFALLPAVGYRNGETEQLLPHAAYMLCHANVWHLAGNLFVLWIMRGKLHLIPSVMIAFLTSFIPSWSMWGEVGVTMALVYLSLTGRKFGR